MAVRFRNLDVDPASPVASWPAEALEIALDRGSLGDWRRLAAEIRRSPWGRVARTVEDIAGWGEHDAVDALMLSILERARAKAATDARQRYADHLRELRTGHGLTLVEVARLAGTSASRLSAYERAHVAPTTEVLGRIERAVQLAVEAERTTTDEEDSEESESR